ncbi:MAG: hypothetical protein AABY18_02615 [Candidatus Thermoplasmatota archaeon]
MVVRVATLAFLLLAALWLPAAWAQDPPVADATQTREDILKQPGLPVTFYGHIFAHGTGDPMPMNTQFPTGEADYSIGEAGGCGQPPPLPAGPPHVAGGEDCETWGSNTQLWYSTAGFVQVKTAEAAGCPDCDYTLFHNERGLTKDVFVDLSQKPVSTYYMSADFHGWVVTLCQAVCWNWDPGMFQDWVVESWMFHAPLGELHADADKEPDLTPVLNRDAKAVLMAHGKTEPIDMVSLDPTIPTGVQTVYPFVSEMEWDPAFAATDGSVPNTSNIVMQFRWYQETDGQKYILGYATAFPNWNVNSGEDYPANVVVPVRNPIDVELVYPQFIHDKLVLLSVINTPWGSYDIDPSLITLTVKDASGNKVAFKDGTLAQVLEQSVAHSGHYMPIKPTWVWDYKTQGLEPGDYSVTVGVTNFQHSVTTETTALFTINKDGGGEAQEGRSGIQTLQGNLHAGHEGTAADPNSQGKATSTAPATTTEKSPGLALPLFVAGLVALVVLRRRKA